MSFCKELNFCFKQSKTQEEFMSKIIIEFGDRFPVSNEPYFKLEEKGMGLMELTMEECSKIVIGSPLLQKYLEKCGVRSFSWARIFNISFSGNDSSNLLSLQSILDSLKKIKSNPSMIEHDQNCRLDENSSKEESLNTFKKIFEEDLEEFIINLENLIEEEQK